MNRESTDLDSSSVAFLLVALGKFFHPLVSVFLQKWETSPQQSLNLIPALLAVMFLVGFYGPP